MKYKRFYILYVTFSITFAVAMENSKKEEKRLSESDGNPLSKSQEKISNSPSDFIWGMTQWVCNSATQTIRYSQKKTFEGQQIYLGIGDVAHIHDKSYQERLNQEQEKNRLSYSCMEKLAKSPIGLSALLPEERDLVRSAASRMHLVPLYLQHYYKTIASRDNALAQEQHAVKLLKENASPFIATLEMIARIGKMAQDNLRSIFDVTKTQQPDPQEDKKMVKDQEQSQEDKKEESESESEELQEDKPQEIEQATLLSNILDTLVLLQTQIGKLDSNKSHQRQSIYPKVD